MSEEKTGLIDRFIGWLTRSFGRRRLPTSHEATLELIEECRAIVDYLRMSGKMDDDVLIKALIAAEALSPDKQVLQSDEVVALQLQLNKARSAIPFTTISSLKGGWRPDKDRWREKIKNICFVGLALALMLAVAHLTQVYGRGVALLADLRQLEESDAFLQFGRLERRILLSNERFREAVTDPTLQSQEVREEGSPAEVRNTPSGQTVASMQNTEAILLANEALFQYITDLVKLDRRIGMLHQSAERFMFEAQQPFAQVCDWYVVGIICTSDAEANAQRAQEILAELKRGAGAKDENNPETDLARFAPSQTPSGFSQPTLARFCQDLEYIDAVRNDKAREILQKSQAYSAESFNYFNELDYLFYEKFGVDAAEVVKQNCELNMNYYSSFLPFIQSLIASVSFHTSRYSYIILPCLYGALGSFVFFMRRILDPLQPNPPMHRMAFRVALGALAGTSLAWLWEGVFKSNGELEAVGFGLFTLAFIFGFAIDVFFTLLDQLVTIANNAAKRIGAPQDAEG